MYVTYRYVYRYVGFLLLSGVFVGTLPLKYSLHFTPYSFLQLTSCYNESDRYYTQEEAREVVQYAKNRGIRVIPEIDIP